MSRLTYPPVRLAVSYRMVRNSGLGMAYARRGQVMSRVRTP